MKKALLIFSMFAPLSISAQTCPTVTVTAGDEVGRYAIDDIGQYVEVEKRPGNCETPITVYPNPTDGIVNIDGWANTEGVLYGTDGRTIGLYKPAAQLDISALPQAVYYLVINRHVLKIVKF
jgi:hypothetical protein